MLRALLTGLLLASCSPSEPGSEPLLSGDTAAALPAGEWDRVVAERIRNASHAFVAEGGAYTAEVVEKDLFGRFASDGVTITLGGAADFTFRRAGHGRGEPASASPAEPSLGDCDPARLDPEGHCLARLEITDGDGVTEWWTATEHGFEQGFVVESPPPGHGDLVFDVEVVGAEAAVGREQVRITDGRGGELIVSALHAWDADGEALPARFAPTPGGFRMVVDDGAARYPIEIDPLYSTSSDWSVAGTAGNNPLGGLVEGAGDVDGDGYDDVLVANTTSGTVYLFEGGSSGVSTTAAATLTPAYVPYCLGGRFDVNGDGYDDVLVGSYGLEVFHGSATGLSTTASTTLASTYTSGGGGTFACDAAGDVDGDGYDDVVVGNQTHNSAGGAFYVFHGSASGVSTTPARTVAGSTPSADRLGCSVSRAGDVNADGYDDIVVGATGAGTSTTGAAYVYNGSASGIGSTATTTISGSSTTDATGALVGFAGDTDGDGYDDILVYSSTGSVYTTYAYVYRGSATGTTTGGVSTIRASVTSFGTAGDVDGDGYDDVLIGTASSSSSTSGAAQIFHGSIAGLYTTATTTITGSGGSYLGTSVGALGDVNGDGYGDIVVSAPGSPGSLGAAGVYHGSATGIPTTATTSITGATDDYLGTAVSSAGDVDNDGYDDVIVGAPGYNQSTGRAYVYLGSSAGLATTASRTLTGSSTGTSLGSAVFGLGDVNKDGYDDVVVGTSKNTAYVFHGSSSGVGTSAAITLGAKVAGPAGDVNDDGYDDILITDTSDYLWVHHGSTTGISPSPATWWSLGYTPSVLAPAGDVNADGYGDVLVGISGYSSGTGRVYVYKGSASSIGTTGSATLTGFNVGDYFGGAVAHADLNGDTYEDVVVGAVGYDGETGRIYVYHGSSSGVGTGVKSIVTGGARGDKLGAALANVGDLDADGYADVAVLASGAGEATVYTGSSTGIDTTPIETLSADATTLASAGDVNADGFADLLFGNTAADSNAGEVFLHLSYVDADSDGFPASEDCDDADPAITGPYVAYADADGDGFGDAAKTAEICGATTGYVANAADCDDGSAAVRPGGSEICDAGDADEDCDGLADDDDPSVTGRSTLYTDADGDGYGSAAAPVSACDARAGVVASATDCDDTDSDVHPGAGEVCDPADVDEDCDGKADDADTGVTGTTTFYADADGDGYGSTAAAFCSVPASGYVSVAGDCDDAAASAHPGGSEVCDSANTDEDCDGLADDADASATGTTTFYVDADGDGYGSTTTGAFCDRPSGYATTPTDCDDTAAARNPGATEVCDAGDLDEDCDGLADDADSSVTGKATWYVDADGDGSGSTTTGAFCDRPSGYAGTSTDCDDTNAAIRPGGTEVCDAADTDEDCDGAADDADASATGKTSFYVDADGDGFGSATLASRCDIASGYADDAGDCDDANASSYPGAVEAVGDEEDGDCDGSELCFLDGDGDGLRGAGTIASSDSDCSDAGELSDASAPDCDDADAGVGAGADEIVGDGVDQDCDGVETCYVDGDADGFRTDDETVASADLDCDDPGEADSDALLGDCDDADARFNPTAEEPNCADPNDYNCDGSVGFEDADADGYAACEECDDGRTAVHPGADEVCNDRDDDCDGEIDVGAVDAERWYADADGDGWVDLVDSVTACDAPAGYAAETEADCDDGDAGSFPGATEVAGDGVDQDCDGSDTPAEEPDTDPDDTGTPPDDKCGCAAAGPGAGWAWLLALAWIRRRR